MAIKVNIRKAYTVTYYDAGFVAPLKKSREAIEARKKLWSGLPLEEVQRQYPTLGLINNMEYRSYGC